MTRIAIVTTVDRTSAIARATMQTAMALSEIAEVTVFAEPTSRPLPCPLALRPIHDDSIRLHDHVVMALGDSPFHVATFHAARRIPSIVILHDVLMAHLMAASLPHQRLHEEFTRWYGAEVAERAMAGAGTPRPAWDGPTALDAPLFDPATELATGIVVHSQFAADHVVPRTVAPVRVIPLAYEAPWTTSARPTVAPDAPTTLLTMGNANENKCHELVIEAVAELGDHSVRYVIAGSITDHRRRHLLGLAAALGIGGQIQILGTVSDSRAANLMDSAMICMNLRMPAIEGGSASLVEQMAAGCCVVVLDHGCYSDAPDAAVVKLPVAVSPVDLAAAIAGLLADPERRAQIGDGARRHAAAAHSFAAYAVQLVDFLDEVDGSRPVTDLARRVAGVSRPWGLTHGSSIAGRWAAAIQSML